MNLYIFNESSRAAIYGVGTYIREITVSLKNSDISICVVNLISDKTHIHTEEIDGISHWYFPAPIQEQRSTDLQKQDELYYRNVVYLLQLHIKDRNNLIFHLNYYENGNLAKELKNAFDCRIVSVVHYSGWGLTVYDNLQRLRNILNEKHPDNFEKNLKKSFEEEKSFYSKVDHIICLSNYMQEILCRDYGLDATKISVISNGLFDVANTIINRKFLRKKWNLGAGEKIILFAGRMDEIKGLVFLIKAFHRVLFAYPQSRLVIAGDGDFRKFFKDAQDICTKVTYTGFLDKTQLYEWYSLADIGVIPSLYEPFGYVAVEMMMHRLPVVATATSGLNEVIDDGSGIKIPVMEYPDRVEIDFNLLADKIIYLLEHPKEAKRLAQNARKRYEELYSTDVFRRNMLKLYNTLL